MRPTRRGKFYGISVCVCSIFLSLASFRLNAQTEESAAQDSARHFVQRFYDWYAPIAFKESRENIGPASDVALKYRPNVFSPELFRALKKDSDASKKVEGYITGLDFDPFLGSQDPERKYRLETVTREDGRYRIDVFAQSSEAGKKPDVVAELARNKGDWVFTNFYYPGAPQADLLSTLKLLARGRRGHAK